MGRHKLRIIIIFQSVKSWERLGFSQCLREGRPQSVGAVWENALKCAAFWYRLQWVLFDGHDHEHNVLNSFNMSNRFNWCVFFLVTNFIVHTIVITTSWINYIHGALRAAAFLCSGCKAKCAEIQPRCGHHSLPWQCDEVRKMPETFPV